MFSGLMFCFFRSIRPSHSQEKQNLKKKIQKPSVQFSNPKDRAVVVWGDTVFFFILTSTCSEQHFRLHSCKIHAIEDSL